MITTFRIIREYFGTTTDEKTVSAMQRTKWLATIIEGRVCEKIRVIIDSFREFRGLEEGCCRPR